MSRLKAPARWLLSLIMVYAGVMHFRATESFAEIIPDWLPAHRFLVLASGAAEIALGLALAVPKLRRASAWGLIALYIAVFPANLNMALHDLPAGSLRVPQYVLWLRLPLQLVLIAWAAWYTRSDRFSR